MSGHYEDGFVWVIGCHSKHLDGVGRLRIGLRTSGVDHHLRKIWRRIRGKGIACGFRWARGNRPQRPALTRGLLGEIVRGW